MAKNSPTILAQDLNFEGEISSTGLIEIQGNVNGTIKGNNVTLRESGKIEGTVIADHLNIKGKFEGSIKANKITISSKASIIGNIEYELLSVEDGASIDGQFKKICNKNNKKKEAWSLAAKSGSKILSTTLLLYDSQRLQKLHSRE